MPNTEEMLTSQATPSLLACCLQVRQRGAAAFDDAGEVDRHDPVEIVARAIGKGRDNGQPGVVDDAIEPPEFGRGAIDPADERLGIGDIERGDAGRAVAEQALGFRQARRVAVCQCQNGALFGEIQRQRPADAAAGAGYRDHLVVERVV